MKDAVKNTELKNPKEIAERDIKSHMENKEAKLRLHLWTKEKYKDKALKECAEKAYIAAKKERDKRFGERTGFDLSCIVNDVDKNTFINNFIERNILDIRFPSLSYTEIHDFINSLATDTDHDIAIEFICLDNNIYKYIDIHFKHLLSNGAIQIFIDGINYTKNPTMYNINLALMTAINTTDNSLKFRNAIANK